MKSVLDVLKAKKYRNLGIEVDIGTDIMEKEDFNLLIDEMTTAMNKAAKELEFEIAAELRDKINELKEKMNE